MVIITIGFLLCVGFTLWQSLLSLSLVKRSKLPPGPAPLPIIGNINKLGNNPHKSLADLAKIYGPLMHLKLGRKSTIVISSSVTAKQVLQKQDLAFSSRPIRDVSRSCNHFMYSVVWLPVGSQWRNLRKIMTTKLFTINRLNANQHLRSRKVQELIVYCVKCSQTGEPVDIGQAAFWTSLNLLSNTIFSRDMIDPYQDSATELRDLVWNIMLETGKPNLVDFFPVFEKIDPQGIRKRLTCNMEKLMKILDGFVDERMELKRLGKSVENTDVLDELVKIPRENPNEIDRTHIDHMFLDLFVAGTDTTSSTVEWGMAEVVKKPEIMLKAKAEMKQVIGKGNMVEEADIAQLPYLHCIVKETLRFWRKWFLTHSVEEEVKLNGFTIPKDSEVLVNVWASGRDPLLYNNPLSFEPERFVQSEIDVKGQDFELIPFGAGRRICPGLPLSMRMIPVMLGSLINCMDWKLEGGITAEQLNMEEKFGFTLAKLHPLGAVPDLV